MNGNDLRQKMPLAGSGSRQESPLAGSTTAERPERCLTYMPVPARLSSGMHGDVKIGKF